MAPAHDPVSEQVLLNLTAQAVGVETGGPGRADLLDDLEVSTIDLLALVAVLEDRCEVVLPDCDLARCETLGDLFDHLRARAVFDAMQTLDDRAEQMADAGSHHHGQRAPEGDPRRRAPGRRSTSFRPGNAQERQAS
ncbi:hypothetical protein BH10PSE4_BH10PSE4_38920 [soil metagenome]